MTFGLLNGILGGGSGLFGSHGATQNSGGAAAPSTSQVNQFNQALNCACSTGSTNGSQQGGFFPGGAQGLTTTNNAQSNITNSLISGINANGGGQQAQGAGFAPHGHGNVGGAHSSHAHSGGSAHGSSGGSGQGISTSGSVGGQGDPLGGLLAGKGKLISGLLGGITGGSTSGSGDLLGGLHGGKGNLISGLLGGITGGSAGGGSGGMGSLIGAPLGLFSNLVGHDSAAKAAANGDVQGWLVNTFDHSGHSHGLGGNSGGGSSAPLGILGTIGQEAGGLVGLDKVFGSAHAYDAQNGTNYASGGSPNYGVTGGLGLGSLLGGSGAGKHGGHSGH